ncbi:hypothetical protein GGS23DRAFT_614708 [Durotheca rogersii]|uniref:uncharacterized protein n=1 Tax=Durotheca rogersii TaxID=419775 RepID=UPI0022205211|nr:uncharacterized protein GGS23DRAFT_614708 [Durotheca rogersii]KAI5859877.1 hypothetical protein GGS23DRAFT_614708 [Durotheca rogersii]
MSATRLTMIHSALPEDVLRVVLSHSLALDCLLSLIASCRPFLDAFRSSPAALPRLAPTRPPPVVRTTPSSVRVIRLVPERGAELQTGIAFGAQAKDLSGQELVRIKRALYRFELYCKLFPPPEQHYLESSFITAQLVFSRRFPAWENEQLASIRESLWRKVTPGAFNALAPHGISRGEFHTSYVVEFDDPFTEEILSGSLRGILDLVCAETYERRYEPLGCDVPAAPSLFLHEAFKEYNFLLLKHDNSTYAGDSFISAGDDAVIERDTAPPYRGLEDTGPEKIWKRSHQDESRALLAKEPLYKSMRECGFVFLGREEV